MKDLNTQTFAMKVGWMQKRPECEGSFHITCCWCALTDKSDVFWEGARRKLRFVVACGTDKQEDQR